ncbi:hypothetical protein M231_02645 [Tremella mesenterica]|uniref:Uncharacterized protein n=1 Tax=Tremella mesenterica TaxID=5217 RepID=A0A4Q1BQ06_TREME|nr:hypothetical protein M231_02645 [Tremella mesenterica]
MSTSLRDLRLLWLSQALKPTRVTRSSLYGRYAVASSGPVRVRFTPSTSLRRHQEVYTFNRKYATSSGPLSPDDPTDIHAQEIMDEATQELEQGDLNKAREKYKSSLGMKETSAGWFNLGVCEYHLKNIPEAIKAWERSITLDPSSDAYTNLASAYILSKPPQAAMAIKHLTSALELSPDDPEIAFNLAAVLESTNNLETALKLYRRAEKGGISRAGQNIRSVSAKLLTQSSSSSSPPSSTSINTTSTRLKSE